MNKVKKILQISLKLSHFGKIQHESLSKRTLTQLPHHRDDNSTSEKLY